MISKEEALNRFRDAVAEMPFGQERITLGQQFNCYESSLNDEDDDPADLDFFLCLGPITDHAIICEVASKWRADLIESALRLALIEARGQ